MRGEQLQNTIWKSLGVCLEVKCDCVSVNNRFSKQVWMNLAEKGKCDSLETCCHPTLLNAVCQHVRNLESILQILNQEKTNQAKHIVLSPMEFDH